MSEYNVVDNTELVELIEQGLKKGYWDKALIPELKKRFEKAQKQEKLLELYRYLEENANDYDLHYETVDEIHNKIDKIEESIKEDKEKENEKL